ncbi:NAD(P)/FAD-dependent oxidoreductase [Sansalvadorimonas sp. 2012CJ34-2]|uniref:NAD(P)/FAD-dependent oxidoreductase n=1 Tax=Parendozoicomonas callyspongiae TaxID=2942213 RepID=A0ABT0PCD1_9GAMM|nr:NAD(P)/FAD-dependent oxidoreductase [Sansalvadorimonas sp. 2012CJ34-2]MCL6269043.1 NAD(P)/FAD-dependent oxidoreductase [Sansalvadorimonas sp. 2012CJ34-2]
MNAATEHFDVLIIGAGLSGIGLACHLVQKSPGKSFAILEGRDSIGGTWDLFRYPGIRSDSDMFTLGYNFKPWENAEPIAQGGDIRRYIEDAATEHGIDKKIRFGHRVISAEWSSEQVVWLVKTEDAQGQTKEFSCRYLAGCTGYYSYESGYDPAFPGREEFQGDIFHPQKWPEGYDYSGKKVVVIGSGATAVTLVPAMADVAGHVTMLQRSPSYILTLPMADPIVDGLRRIFPEAWVYRLTRFRNISVSWLIYNFCRLFPGTSRNLLLRSVRKQLPDDFDMKHFSSAYAPWDERLCIVPDGDLFKAISAGKASVATDHIERFTEKGILLKSGEELEADVIITATGLNVQAFGKMKLAVDGKPYEHTQKMCYRGVLYEDLPNFAMIFGYTNASWTLKADLAANYICRLLNYMDQKGYTACMPRNAESFSKAPFMDMQSGYIQRAKSQMPLQGTKKPWKVYQNYLLDILSLRLTGIEDRALKFTRLIPSTKSREKQRERQASTVSE